MTNRCPCACVFCLRHNKDHVFNSDSLWLEREPTVKEICDSIDAWDLGKYEELVFCGYGEPTERLDDLLQVAAYVKSRGNTKIRINTNGLADLICGVCKRNTDRSLSRRLVKLDHRVCVFVYGIVCISSVIKPL